MSSKQMVNVRKAFVFASEMLYLRNVNQNKRDCKSLWSDND